MTLKIILLGSCTHSFIALIRVTDADAVSPQGII